jgi:Alpha-L-fucosidase
MNKLIAILTAILSLAATSVRACPEISPDFLKTKYGFFVHYVWGGKGRSGSIDSSGRQPDSFDMLADAFDVVGFANDMAAWQVEYVVFTAWHANINPLFPSETMKKWGMPDHTCKRDLIGEMIKALKAKGIPVVLYTHPRVGHDLYGEDRVKTGWGMNSSGVDPDWNQFDYQKWNDFTNDLYAELVDRYGKDITGLFLDEGSESGNSHRVVDYPRLRQTIKSRAPHLVLQQNYYGSIYSCDVGVKEYHHWQQFENPDGGAWPAWDIPVATAFATTWFSARPASENAAVYSAEDIFRYTVLQAGANTCGGGVQWAAGPFVGGGWETGVRETMEKFASYLKPVARSIKGTLASSAFPTRKGATLKNMGARAVDWGVATDSPDRTITYLHILNPPAGSAVRLGMPANGVRFSKATLLTTGQPVALDLDKAGYLVTLPDGINWDKLDTVIRLDKNSRVQAHSSEPQSIKKTVGIAYNTHHRKDWNQFAVQPLLAKQLEYPSKSYNTDDPRVIRQHGEWLADAGVDYALMDWSNNIDYDPAAENKREDFRMIEGSVPAILDIWKTIPGAPQFAILLGAPDNPEAFSDGRLQRKVDQVHQQFLANPAHEKQYFRLEGKPLLVIYAGTPCRFPNGLPGFADERFTIRFLTGFITEQPNLREGLLSKYGYWSWEDRGDQTYTVVDGKPEFCVVTSAQREQGEQGKPGHVPATPRNDGNTFKARWARARELGVSTVLVVAWNEFHTWECQERADLNKDIEPTVEDGDFYLRLMKEEIGKFKTAAP